MGKSTWDTQTLIKFYQLKQETGDDLDLIAKKLKRSKGAIDTKNRRMDWDAFIEDPENYRSKHEAVKKWTDEEMIQLDAYLQTEKCSYAFIADKMGRSITSVERQAQVTDWAAWRKMREAVDVDGDQADLDDITSRLVYAVLELARHDFDRLQKLKEDFFLRKVNLEKEKLAINFTELKEKAKQELLAIGFGNPDSVTFGKGTYVIVGDSHGKHTNKAMFQLLKKINATIKPKKIIHVGHILDDDNDISYDWGSFDNLIVLAKVEELKTVHGQRNKFKFSYDVVRESVGLGDLIVMNQDMISDYVKTPLTGLDAEIFDTKMVVNCHRLEFFTRCFNDEPSYVASPGSLCEKHIIKTVKQMDFTDGKEVKQAYHSGFSKYRRMNHMNKYWDNGLIVVQVDGKGNQTVIPCPIKKTGSTFTMAYFDKMISSKKVFNPDRKIFVNGDLHCDQHDVEILDIQEQICRDYRPDVCVNVGDTHNYGSLNHHIMDRGGVILEKKILDEAAQTHFVLKRLAKWSKESHLIYGNHERFAKDFLEKYPQFGNYLDLEFICDLQSLGYELTSLKDVLKIAGAKFIHGEMKFFGLSGNVLEKASRAFGEDIFIGHIHCPAIRFGCYSVGLSGKINQSYNETEATKWMHGFGLCNQYQGQNWPTTIAIINNKCLINNKTYRPSSKASSTWKTPEYKARLTFVHEK